MQLCVSVILFVPISVSGLTLAGGYFLTSEASLPFYTNKISLGDGILRKCVFVIGLPWHCALKTHWGDVICQTASYGGQGLAVPTVNTSLDANVSPVHKQQVCGWKYVTKVAVNTGNRDKKIEIEKGDEDNILQLPLKVWWLRVKTHRNGESALHGQSWTTGHHKVCDVVKLYRKERHHSSKQMSLSSCKTFVSEYKSETSFYFCQRNIY